MRRARAEWLEGRLLLCALHGEDDEFGDRFAVGPIATNMTLRPEIASQSSAAGARPLVSNSFTTQPNGLPILNSYPTAPAAIYLDFDGGPVWGGAAAGGVDEPAFDTDGNPSTFNADEQAHIYYLWRQVAMYYSMFNVNVTTIEPENESHAWNVVGPYNGGVNSVGSFPDSRAEGISSDWIGFGAGIAHEVGHDFGNWHTSSYDNLGNKTQEYRTVDTPLRGTIMGGGEQVINKWTNWHSSLSADVNQDDMEFIRSHLDAVDGSGDGYKPDDYGGTIATATPLTVSGNTQTITGVIERLNDADAFSFDSTGGTYNIMVGRDGPSGVDVKMSLYNSSGNLIASDDGDPRAQPYTMVNDSHLTIDLTAGKYYIFVESHGNYDDQGQYIVRVDPGKSGWASADPGLNALNGYANYDSTSSMYTLTGSGHDIWGASDGAQYFYQQLSNGGSITAKLTSLGAASEWAQAGVMIRESLAADAKEFSMMITSNRGPNAVWRANTADGSSGVDLNTTKAFAPTWVRITRLGTLFKAFTSTDGISFTQFASTNISMGSAVYIGLVASAVDDATQDRVVHNQETATFSNVSLSGALNPGITLNSLAAPSGLTITSTTYNSAGLSWSAAGYLPGDANGDGNVNSVDFTALASNFNGGGKTRTSGDFNGDGFTNALDFNALASNFARIGATGYSIERSTNDVNFGSIAVVAPNVGGFSDSALGDKQRYFYRVRTVSGSTYSQPTVAINTITRAGVVINLNVISFAANKLIVDWTDASGETSYQLQRSTDGVNGWSTVGTVGANFQMYVDSAGLSANTAYYYRVVTIDAGGFSATSAVASGTTRLTDVGGLSFTTKASNQMAIQWSAVSGATGYNVERSLDGTNWSLVSSNQTATSYTDTNVVPLGEYYYRVAAISATNSSANATKIFAAAPAASALPAGWTSVDIGAVGGTGAAGFSGGTFTAVASGDDIWNNADAFRFTYVSLPGNGWIQARVASLETATSIFAKAAVMIRQSTSAGSKHAMMALTPSGAYFQYRTSTNGGSGGADPVSATSPIWLRIERTLTGTFLTTSSIVGEISTDGVNWTTVGSINISNMSGTVLMGLALTAQNNNQLNTSTFDNVSSSVTGLVT